MDFGEIGHQLGLSSSVSGQGGHVKLGVYIGLSNFSEFILSSSQCKVGDSRWMISSILRIKCMR